MNLTQDIIDFEAMIEEAEYDPLEQELGDHDGAENLETAFSVMSNLMDRFKDFCDACEKAWKIQEIPPSLRQRLITIDKDNQDRYQKLYLMFQKHAGQMKEAQIRPE